MTCRSCLDFYLHFDALLPGYHGFDKNSIYINFFRACECAYVASDFTFNSFIHTDMYQKFLERHPFIDAVTTSAVLLID